MHRFLLSCIIFCSLCELIIANPILGQNVRQTAPGEFLSVVSIKRVNNSNTKPETDHICTGTLISRKDVITAAHCESYFSGNNCEVIVGSNNIRKGLSMQVYWWMTFLEWTGYRNKRIEYEENDIAIIRLREYVPKRIPISMYGKHSDHNYYGQVVSAAAFGRSGIGENKFFRHMQTINLTIMSTSKCENKIQEVRGIKYDMNKFFLCATATPYALMTGGNSGSPIFYRKKLIGIHKGICPSLEEMYDPRKINLFLSIYYFKEFIDDVIHNF